MWLFILKCWTVHVWLCFSNTKWKVNRVWLEGQFWSQLNVWNSDEGNIFSFQTFSWNQFQTSCFEINRLFVLFRCLYWWPAGGSKHQTSLHKCTVLLHPHDQTEHSEACWAQGGAAAPGNQTHTKPGGIQVPSEFILKNYLLILTDRQKERQTGADHQSSKTTKTKWSRSNNFYFPLNSFMSCCDIIAMLAVTSWLWCHLLVLLAFWMKLME